MWSWNRTYWKSEMCDPEVLKFRHPEMLKLWKYDPEILKLCSPEIRTFWKVEMCDPAILKFRNPEMLKSWKYLILKFWNYKIMKLGNAVIMKLCNPAIWTCWKSEMRDPEILKFRYSRNAEILKHIGCWISKSMELRKYDFMKLSHSKIMLYWNSEILKFWNVWS